MVMIKKTGRNELMKIIMQTVFAVGRGGGGTEVLTQKYLLVDNRRLDNDHECPYTG